MRSKTGQGRGRGLQAEPLQVRRTRATQPAEDGRPRTTADQPQDFVGVEVVERLRAAKRGAEEERRSTGHEAGRMWACGCADPEELERLADYLASGKIEDGAEVVNWLRSWSERVF